MNIKYAIIPVMLAAVLGFAAAPAFARQGSDDAQPDDRKEERLDQAFDKLNRQSPPKVMIQNGRVELNAATVTDVDGSTATVKVFGHSFTVKTGDARFKEGTTLEEDARVWIKGQIDADTGVVTASEVRTFTGKSDDDTATTTRDRVKLEGFQKQMEDLMERLKKLLGN